jgi:G3E family GTPase
LLNKVDLVDEKRCSEVKEFVAGINSTSQIFNTENAKINILLLENIQYIRNNEKKESCDSNFTKPVSIILDQKNINKKQIIEFFNSIKNQVLRLKGFLLIDGSPYYLSNNNESLSVTKFSDLKNIKYGISVLLQKEDESIVNEQWEKL